MATIPYTVKTQKCALGALKGKLIYVAVPVISHRLTTREFVEEVAHNTTLNSGEVEAVLREAAIIVRKRILEGASVQFGDFGSFLPGFKTIAIEAKEGNEFDPVLHIENPRIRFIANRKYFALPEARFALSAKDVALKELAKKQKENANTGGGSGESGGDGEGNV